MSKTAEAGRPQDYEGDFPAEGRPNPTDLTESEVEALRAQALAYEMGIIASQIEHLLYMKSRTGTEIPDHCLEDIVHTLRKALRNYA